jgi:RNA polymerase sigma-70 factor, ECF subfamily
MRQWALRSTGAPARQLRFGVLSKQRALSILFSGLVHLTQGIRYSTTRPGGVIGCMPRILTVSRQNQAEGAMSICEGRQGAETQSLATFKAPGDVPSFGLTPILTIAFSDDCEKKSRKAPCDLSDPVKDGGVVFAVRPRSESGNLSRPASHHRDHRFVEEGVCDEMLLRNVAQGDKVAMHILFARHRKMVFRLVQRIVPDRTVAGDLVNQVFLDVWRSANRFECRSRVSTWLFQIARLKARSSLRGRAYENIDREEVLGIADSGDTPEEVLDSNDVNGALRACISKLSPAHREIIDLVYFRKKSAAEVSEIVGIPHATVRSRMFYARKQLARMLMGAGLTLA